MVLMIVSSIRDPASENIKKRLTELSSWEEMGFFQEKPLLRHSKMKDVIIVTISDSKITHENLDKELEKEMGIKPKQAIFLSRHKSKTGEPTLTVHPLGNFGEASYGGKARTLVKSSPLLMTKLLRIIKNKDPDYKVCYEVTHHGPYLDIPTFFVEIGSTEKEWNRKEPAYIIASSLTEMLEKYRYEGDLPIETVLVGIGGGHYAPRFTDIVLERKAAFGHMIPVYQLRERNDEIFLKALEKTPNIKGVYLHKKTLKKSQVKEYKKWFLDRGVPTISSKELPLLS